MKTVFAALAATMTLAVPTLAQEGFSDSLRRYSDNHTVPFQVGTAVSLHGEPSKYPPNGYQPGLLTNSTQDVTYQAIVRGQFNQIEPGNELKMRWLWTGGAARVNGSYVVQTNLFDASGPLALSCAWAEAQTKHLTVRGHCMVYNQNYTLPKFPADQTPLFTQDSMGKQVLNPVYQPSDMREMLKSYVEQVVDATMAQNAKSRKTYHYKVVPVWDVTNEVVSESTQDTELPGAGFAYRGDDPWYNNGPRGTDGTTGYDYVNDIYRWAADEMKANVGKTLGGQKITAADSFALYYNEYNLEWNASKMQHVRNLIKHIRARGGTVDGLGFQAHIEARGLATDQFDAAIAATIADGLRFSITELDCAIKKTPRAGWPSEAEQGTNQGREMGTVAGLCVKYQKSCDCFQIWGAIDDGSWIQNEQATIMTRWVEDTRPGTTKGKVGYWPKQGQFSPATLFDPATGELDPKSGHIVSDAYDQILAALKTKPLK